MTELVVPDEIEPTVGWRGWRYDPHQGLVSPQQSAVWEPRKALTAECISTIYDLEDEDEDAQCEKHGAPGHNCNCGIHASADFQQSWDQYRSGEVPVLGLVSLWGRVVEGEYGWRAEKAYPHRLWVVQKRESRLASLRRIAWMLEDEYGIRTRVAPEYLLRLYAKYRAPRDEAKITAWRDKKPSLWSFGGSLLSGLSFSYQMPTMTMQYTTPPVLGAPAPETKRESPVQTYTTGDLIDLLAKGMAA